MEKYAVYKLEIGHKPKVFGDNDFRNCLMAAVRYTGRYCENNGTYIYRSWTENDITYVDGENGVYFIEKVVDNNEKDMI